MTEDQLKAILLRNPENSARDNSTLAQIFASDPQPGEENALVQMAERETESETRITIRFIFRCTRLADADVIHGRGKDLLDGLQNAQLIPGDREDQIRLEAVQQKVSAKAQEGTLIEIIWPQNSPC